MGIPGANMDIMLWIAIPGKNREAAWCFGKGVFDQVRWQPDTLAIHPGPSFFEYLSGAFVFHFQAYVFQDVEYTIKQLLKLIIR